MQIINYRIRTAMGVVSNQTPLNFLSKEEQAEFDNIGYTGKKLNGVKIGRVEYLNSLRPNEEQFQMERLKYDNGDFTEEFLITRVIIPQ